MKSPRATSRQPASRDPALLAARQPAADGARPQQHQDVVGRPVEARPEAPRGRVNGRSIPSSLGPTYSTSFSIRGPNEIQISGLKPIPAVAHAPVGARVVEQPVAGGVDAAVAAVVEGRWSRQPTAARPPTATSATAPPARSRRRPGSGRQDPHQAVRARRRRRRARGAVLTTEPSGTSNVRTTPSITPASRASSSTRRARARTAAGRPGRQRRRQHERGHEVAEVGPGVDGLPLRPLRRERQERRRRARSGPRQAASISTRSRPGRSSPRSAATTAATAASASASAASVSEALEGAAGRSRPRSRRRTGSRRATTRRARARCGGARRGASAPSTETFCGKNGLPDSHQVADEPEAAAGGRSAPSADERLAARARRPGRAASARPRPRRRTTARHGGQRVPLRARAQSPRPSAASTRSERSRVRRVPDRKSDAGRRTSRA